jgi:hypothetical protein
MGTSASRNDFVGAVVMSKHCCARRGTAARDCPDGKT